MGKFIDLTGQRFGRLCVVVRVDNDNAGKVRWLCQCDCGEKVVVRASDLKKGATQSCGCLQKEVVALQSQKNIKHGMTGTRLYNIWLAMNARCYDDSHISYKYYGGRGITVCDDWKISPQSFSEWAMSNGYCDNLTLDRVDANASYCPENCRWINQKSQANNRRNNRLISIHGETHTLSEWSNMTGIRSDTLRYRINAGWPFDELCTPPCR